MSWNFFKNDELFGYNFSKHQDIKKYLDDILSDNDYQVMTSSIVGNAYYSATKDKKAGIVFADVVLICHDQGDFGYKHLEETNLPMVFDCPQKILKQLTPTHNENAQEWRKLCCLHHERKQLLAHARKHEDTLTIIFSDNSKYLVKYSEFYHKWLVVDKTQYIQAKDVLEYCVAVNNNDKFQSFNEICDKLMAKE